MMKKTIIAAILAAIPISANAAWEIVSIESPNGVITYGTAINNSGVVTGYYGDFYDGLAGGFITGANGIGFTDISTLSKHSTYPNEINYSGQVVGSIANPSMNAFITGTNGVGMIDISTPDWSHSAAYGVNNSGQAVGIFIINGEVGGRAFITGNNGEGMTDIGTLGGLGSYAYGINETGQVTGSSALAGHSPLHAFITGADGSEMTDLGTLGGLESQGFKINDLGQVVGYSDTADGSRHAFITGPNGSGMMDLGDLGADSSQARSINNLGQVVGNLYMDCYCNNNSFVFSDGVMVNIGQLDVVLSSGWTGIVATDINDQGQIVGSGLLNGNRRAFLLTGADDEEFFRNYVAPPIPEPSTYAMLLAGLGLVGFMVRRRNRQQ